MATLHRVVPRAYAPGDGETSAGTTFTYTNGYGQLTKAGVQVQRGATATAHVEIVMVLVTNDTSQSWFSEHKKSFTAAQQSTIQQHFDSGDTASGWNAIFAWGATHSSNQNYFQNANAQQQTTDTDAQTNLVNSASKLQSSKVKVTGDVSIVGVSLLPTQAFVFAEISPIQFADGTSIQVINQANPVAASSSGDTSGAETAPNQKLNVVKI